MNQRSVQRSRLPSTHQIATAIPALGALLSFCRGAVARLANLLPDLFAVHRNVGRRGDAQPDSIPFDRDDRDGQLAARQHNTFTDFATENEHAGSSLRKSSS